MRVTVISPTIQEFQRLCYYLCGEYFQRNGVRLHRVVWEYDRGRPVPAGHAVHHRDEDRSNNQPGNLELLTRGDHTSLHQTGHQRGVTDAAREAAKEWHGSPEGRAWHRRQYANTKDALHCRQEYKCENCGKLYEAQTTGKNRFCSNGCKSQSRLRSGVDDVDRTCVECGKVFRVNRYHKKKTCGQPCASAVSVRNRRRA